MFSQPACQRQVAGVLRSLSGARSSGRNQDSSEASCLPLGNKCTGISESFVSVQKTKPGHMLVRNYCQGFGFIFGLK